jgi:hypothetical protein
MVSIDGTEISGATIGGTEVQEITMDGDVVWTAGPTEPTITPGDTVWTLLSVGTDEDMYGVDTSLNQKFEFALGGNYGLLGNGIGNSVDENGVYLIEFSDTTKCYDENGNSIQTYNATTGNGTVGYDRIWCKDYDNSDIVGVDKETDTVVNRWSVDSEMTDIMYNKGESLFLYAYDYTTQSKLYEYDFDGNKLLDFSMRTLNDFPREVHGLTHDRKLMVSTDSNAAAILDIDSQSYDWVSSSTKYTQSAAIMKDGNYVFHMEYDDGSSAEIRKLDRNNGSVIHSYTMSVDEGIGNIVPTTNDEVYIQENYDGINETESIRLLDTNFNETYSINPAGTDDVTGMAYLPKRSAYPSVYN